MKKTILISLIITIITMSFIIFLISLNLNNKTKALSNHNNDYLRQGGTCIKSFNNAQRIDYTNFTSLTNFNSP